MPNEPGWLIWLCGSYANICGTPVVCCVDDDRMGPKHDPPGELELMAARGVSIDYPFLTRVVDG